MQEYYYQHDVNKLRRNLSKFFKVFLITVTFMYICVGSYEYHSFEMFSSTIQGNAYIIPVQYQTILVHLIILILVSVYAICKYGGINNGKNHSKWKTILGATLIVVFDILIIFTSYTATYFSAISDQKVYYQNIASGIQVFDFSDIPCAEVNLSYNPNVDNYYIDYLINLKSGHEIQINNDNDAMATIDRRLVDSHVLIKRPQIDRDTQIKILKWCDEYPENKEPYKQLLGIR